jgi:uncharacterized coiled-coil protein SlyX
MASLLDGIQTGENGWRNIPSIVRATLSQIADAQSSLSQSTQSLATLVSRKANQSDVAERISECATQSQLQHIIEVVQRDVMPRFDAPCAAHSATNTALAALTARISQMETVISAQDKQIQSLTREVSARNSLSRHKPCELTYDLEPQMAEKAAVADLAPLARKTALDDGLRRVTKVTATQVIWLLAAVDAASAGTSSCR